MPSMQAQESRSLCGWCQSNAKRRPKQDFAERSSEEVPCHPDGPAREVNVMLKKGVSKSIEEEASAQP